MEPWADSSDDVVGLLLGEVGREAPNGLDVVVRLDTTISDALWWGNLENRPGLVADDLELRAGVGVDVPLAEGLEDGDSGGGRWCDPVLDRNVFESIGALVAPTTEEE